MIIAGRAIGGREPPYVVAEMSSEHCGELDKALKLIQTAKRVGAHAVKVQLYDPIKLAIARGGVAKVITEGTWKGWPLGKLYETAHTPAHWFPKLFECARDEKITLFSSVFDPHGVDFLEDLGCPAYKISSFELRNSELVLKAASTRKPVILSTGMADEPDILTARALSHPAPLGILHCISGYPCPLGEANLRCIAYLTRRFADCDIGFSDHTLGIIAAITAASLGASIIEKHLTLSREHGGLDASYSLEADEFALMTHAIRQTHEALGGGDPLSEAPYRELRYGTVH